MPPRPLTIGLAATVHPHERDRILAARPRVRIVDLAPLMYAEFPDVVRPGYDPPPPFNGAYSLAVLCRDVDVLFARMLPAGFLTLTPNLKWMQSTTAGVNNLLRSGILDRPEVVLTSAVGLNAPEVAEWALTAIISLGADVPATVRAQEKRLWDRRRMTPLHTKTVGVIGLGAIGRRIAALCKAFDMRVLCVQSTPEAIPNVDEVFTDDRLGDVLERTDIVVLAMPLTPATHGLIDAAALRKMRPTAILINLARDDVVDETALVQALQEGTIAGACLDVFAQQPLSPESPFWSMPNVFLTAHTAGLSDAFDGRLLDRFLENIQRFLAHEPLVGQVDLRGGY